MDAPFTILDVTLFFIVVISGLLAMTRGFLREFFSIISWLCAAAAMLIFYGPLVPQAKKLITNDMVAQIALGAVLFIGTLVIVSIISYIITDKLLSSKIGALDRTLGFIFGAIRGFFLVVACYLLFILFVPNEKDQYTEVTGARTIGLIKDASDILLDALPDKSNKYVSEFLNKMKNARKQTNESETMAPSGVNDQDAQELTTQIEQSTPN